MCTRLCKASVLNNSHHLGSIPANQSNNPAHPQPSLIDTHIAHHTTHHTHTGTHTTHTHTTRCHRPVIPLT